MEPAENLIPGAVTDVRIPIGSLTTARATDSAQLDGTLDSTGDVATQGTILQSQILHDAANNPITSATLLTEVKDVGGSPFFVNGDVISINGIKRGGRDVPAEQFVVGTTGTTVGDYLAWMDQALGIDTTVGVAGSPGVGVTVDGRLEIRGNAGTENALSIQPGTLLSSGSTGVP